MSESDPHAPIERDGGVRCLRSAGDVRRQRTCCLEMRREAERYQLDMKQRELDELRIEEIMVGGGVAESRNCSSKLLLYGIRIEFWHSSLMVTLLLLSTSRFMSRTS